MNSHLRLRALSGGLGIVLLSCTKPATGVDQALPIKPTRTIAFTTDEGSFMDVDGSPDGKTILFDLLGDLYAVPSEGGEATQLTRGVAINRRPVWSPDGKWIAYVSDASGTLRLTVRNLAGTSQRVLGQPDGMDVLAWDEIPDPILWSPDGKSVLFFNTFFGLAGEKERIKDSAPHPIQFSPDGRFLYGLDSGHIVRYARREQVTTALSPALKPAEHVALSPDGRWWAYVADTNAKKALVLRDLTTNTERVLVPSLSVKYPYVQTYHQPRFTFTADSKDLVISYGGKIHWIDAERGTDRIIPFRAHVQVDCGPLDSNRFHLPSDSLHVRYTRYATASPDGQHLVFTALGKLYVMDLPNGQAHPLTSQALNQFHPAYSPDGQWIVYASWSDTASGAVWRVAAHGGIPQKLTVDTGEYTHPAWSPDGAHIAVIHSQVGPNDRYALSRYLLATGALELISVRGGPPRVIDDSVSQKGQPQFSSDGAQLVYRGKGPAPYTTAAAPLVLTRDLEGHAQRPVLLVDPTGVDAGRIEYPELSPDGRFLTFSLMENVYLVPLPQTAKPAVLFDSARTLSIVRVGSGVDPSWEQGGKRLSWSYGDQFYQADPEKILAAQAHHVGNQGYSVVTVQPDQVVHLRVTVPKAYGHGTVALEDVRIITMHGDQVIEHGTVVIKDGRFLMVGPTGQVHIPAEATRLLLPGATVMPGLIDAELPMAGGPDLFQQAQERLASLAYGVTTGRAVTTDVAAFGDQELLESGQMIGPRVFPAGDGVGNANDSVDAADIVQQHAVFGGTVMMQSRMPERRQREWLLMASRAAGLNLTNEGQADPLFHLAMIKDGSTGIEHDPDWWGDVYDDMTTLMCRSGTYFTPTLRMRYGSQLTDGYPIATYWQVPNAKMRRFMSTQELDGLQGRTIPDTVHTDFSSPAKIAARLRHCGMHVMLGSYFGFRGVAPHNELWALQMGGMTNMEALQAATITGAEGLGLQDDLGSIEVGKVADLLVLNRNPLDDIHYSRDIHYVMKDGILYDGQTLNTVWPTKKTLPAFLPTH